MNTIYFTELPAAMALAKEVTRRGIGNGVMPVTVMPGSNGDTSQAVVNDQTSGIYDSIWNWDTTFDPKPIDPARPNAKQYAFRYNVFNQSGVHVQGTNVGLILDQLRRYPMSPEYVFSQLKAEVDRMAAGF